MTQKNEMSACALKMEELEMVTVEHLQQHLHLVDVECLSLADAIVVFSYNREIGCAATIR